MQSVQELEDRLDSNNSISFPVISKPSSGTGSEDVSRANNVAELKDAIEKTLKSTKDCHALDRRQSCPAQWTIVILGDY